MNAPDAGLLAALEEIAAKLPDGPRLALRDWLGDRLHSRHVGSISGRDAKGRKRSGLNTASALMKRGLVEYERDDLSRMVFSLTPLGLAVRAILQAQEPI